MGSVITIIVIAIPIQFHAKSNITISHTIKIVIVQLITGVNHIATLSTFKHQRKYFFMSFLSLGKSHEDRFKLKCIKL